MPFVKVPQESFEIALVFGCCFVIGLFELGVTDKGFAVLAPVLRLFEIISKALIFKEALIANRRLPVL